MGAPNVDSTRVLVQIQQLLRSIGIHKKEKKKIESKSLLVSSHGEKPRVYSIERERKRRSSWTDVFMELSGAGNHDDGDLGIAENSELVGLLEQTVAPLRVGHLPVSRVLDPLDLDLPPRHFFFSLSL